MRARSLVRGTTTGLHHGQPLPTCVALVAEDADPGQPEVTFAEQTPERGEFFFPGVRPGTYEVQAGDTDDACADDGYARADFGGPVTVAAGDVVEGLDAVLVPQPSISRACIAPEPGSTPMFSDVPGGVHRPAIECLVQRQVVKGYSDGTYRPTETVSRDQMAAFIARSLTEAGVALSADPANAFTDDEGNAHELAINQLAQLGVITGKGGGRYAPAEAVTRAQTATLLVHAYEKATGLPLRSAGDAFTDDETDVHEERIDKAATAGLAAGSDGRFDPGQPVRRDQMATFIARMLDRIARDT